MTETKTLLAAGYKGDPIEIEDAAWAVSQALAFVQAIQSTFLACGYTLTIRDTK